MKRILALVLCVFTVICAASLTSCDLLQSVGDISALITEFETNTNILDNFSELSVIALKNNLGEQQDSEIVASFEQNLKILDEVVAFESALFATAKVLENESVKSIVGEYFEEGYTLEHTEGDVDAYTLTSIEGFKFVLKMDTEGNTDKYSLKCEENESVFLFSEIVKTASSTDGTLNMEVQIYYSHPEHLDDNGQAIDITKWQLNYSVSLDANGKISVKYNFNASPESVPQSIFDATYFGGEWKSEGANDIHMELSTTVSQIEAIVSDETETQAASDSANTKTLAQRLVSERVVFDFDKFDCSFEFLCASIDGGDVLSVKDGQIIYKTGGTSSDFDFNTKDVDLRIPDFTAFDQ